jgi:hypothetical protein
MTSPQSRSLLAALAAVAAAAVLGAVQSTIWHGSAAPAAVLARWIDPALDGAPASAAVDPPAVYFAYGRLAVLVYVALVIAGLPLVRTLGPAARRFVATAALIALAGDVVAYWASAAAGPAVRRIGFWYLEVPALLALILAFTWIGIRAPRHRALAIALPAAAVAMAWLRYLPHGLLLGLGAALAVSAVGASRR